ncbi:MAG TPA: DUF3592 domain-containing protein [Pyrinomonadaceae bacterium]|jgi:hypothetical protein
MKEALDALICIVVGGAFGLAAAFTWLRTRRFVEESVPARGEVIELREHRGDGVTYAPVIRFEGPDGRPVVFTESTASNPPDHAVGERVKILYHRADPTRARVASASNLYLLTIIFAAVGAITFAVGVLIAAFAFYR